jgi:hypothetical protein
MYPSLNIRLPLAMSILALLPVAISTPTVTKRAAEPLSTACGDIVQASDSKSSDPRSKNQRDAKVKRCHYAMRRIFSLGDGNMATWQHGINRILPLRGLTWWN